MSPGDVFLGWEGRISRPLFVGCAAAVIGTAFAVKTMLTGFLPEVLPAGAMVMTRVLGNVLLFAATLMTMGALVVKRRHDIGLPARGMGLTFILPATAATSMNVLAGFGMDPDLAVAVKAVSLVAFAWALAPLVFLDGVRGANAYGPDPLDADWQRTRDWLEE